jgi:hypothetical protein
MSMIFSGKLISNKTVGIQGKNLDCKMLIKSPGTFESEAPVPRPKV